MGLTSMGATRSFLGKMHVGSQFAVMAACVPWEAPCHHHQANGTTLCSPLMQMHPTCASKQPHLKEQHPPVHVRQDAAGGRHSAAQRPQWEGADAHRVYSGVQRAALLHAQVAAVWVPPRPCISISLPPLLLTRAPPYSGDSGFLARVRRGDPPWMLSPALRDCKEALVLRQAGCGRRNMLAFSAHRCHCTTTRPKRRSLTSCAERQDDIEERAQDEYSRSSVARGERV